MEFRIVIDNYAGFEVQSWRWWFPIWLQCGSTNTHSTIEDAEAFAEKFAKNGCVVKNLGHLPSNVKLTGAARLYRAASSDRRERG